MIQQENTNDFRYFIVTLKGRKNCQDLKEAEKRYSRCKYATIWRENIKTGHATLVATK